jgi:hypothetical protein
LLPKPEVLEPHQVLTVDVGGDLLRCADYRRPIAIIDNEASRRALAGNPELSQYAGNADSNSGPAKLGR